jgi:hypothetical protein
VFRVPFDGGNEHEITTDGSVPLAPLASNPGALSADGRLLMLLAPPDTWFFVPGIIDTNTGHLTRIRTEGQIVGLRGRYLSTLWRFQPVGK